MKGTREVVEEGVSEAGPAAGQVGLKWGSNSPNRTPIPSCGNGEPSAR